MADVTGRVQKRAAELLEPGEAVIAALLVEPRGTYGIGSVIVAALPRTTVRMLGHRAAETGALEGGLASAFPAKSCVLAATDRRVVVIPSNGISMNEIGEAYDRTDLLVTENHGKGLGRRLAVLFVDGTSVTLDAPRGQPFDAFSAAVGF